VELRHWFQNLNKNKRRLFNFRGSLGRSWDHDWFSYQLCSGAALAFEINTHEHKTSFRIGLLFFTIYLSIYGLRIPFLKQDERKYGFYWYEKEFWASLGGRTMESSRKDPWYYSIHISPLDLIFGRSIFFEDEILKSHQPIEFEFREKQYQMDSIKIKQSFWFRPRIPFSIYHKKMLRADLEIKNPPGYSGKDTPVRVRILGIVVTMLLTDHMDLTMDRNLNGTIGMLCSSIV
jgi:hypothetical protein